MSFDLTQKLSNNFVALCDRYLFSGWQQDDAVLFRARTLIGLLIVYQFIVFAGAIFALFFSSLPTTGNAAALAILLGIFLCFNWLMRYLARSGELMRTAQFSVATAFIGIEAGILVSGGPMLSPSLGVAVVPPVVAFCLIGRRAGLTWAAITFVTQILMIVFDHLGIHYLNLILPEQMGMNRLFNWIVTFSAVIGIVLVYENANNHLQRDRDQQYQRFQHLALHDVLTGLANRKKFTDRLRYALAALSRNNKILAVVYLDLNGFKQINDALGHESGDKALQIIAQRLLDTVRGCDTVARLGGDEFAVLLEDITEQADAEQTVQRLQKAISEPMEALHDYPIHASFGVALAPMHAGDADTLLLMADHAMYDAKKRQQDFRVYNPDQRPIDKNLAKQIRGGSESEKIAAPDRAAASPRPLSSANTAADASLSHRLQQRFINHSNLSLPPHKFTNSDQLFRGRILIGCLRFSQLVAVVFLFNLSTLHDLTLPVRTLIGVLLMAMLIALTLALSYVRRTGNTAGVATVLVAFGFAAIESAILFTGGPALSMTADIALVPPVAAFCLSGRRQGMAWAGVTVLAHCAMLIAETVFGIQVPILHSEQLGSALIINWVVCFLSTVGVLFIFELLYQRLQHERDKQRAQLEYLATHDQLTGVANRRQFFDVLQGALERMRRNKNALAVAYLDLDNFKPVNDTLGHDIGDFVLQTIAQRLRENVRNIDMVARLGGDEFGIIMENVGDLDNVITIVDKLKQAVSQPIAGLETLPVGSSVGIAMSPLHSTDSDALVRMADRAMLRAKISGGIATYEA